MITLIYLFWVDHVWSIEHMYVLHSYLWGVHAHPIWQSFHFLDLTDF